LLPVLRTPVCRRFRFSFTGSRLPTSSFHSFSHLITNLHMSLSSDSTVPTVSTVTISYSELKVRLSQVLLLICLLCVLFRLLNSSLLQESNIDLSARIEEGFGPNGLGILSVKDVWITSFNQKVCCFVLNLSNMY